MNKAKRKIMFIIFSLMIIAGVIGTALLCYFYIPVEYGQSETYTVGDGVNLKVGVISDTQLPPKECEDKTYENHLINALTQLKEQGVEMVIHAGDIGDFNSDYAYDTYKKCIESVWSAEERPVFLNIMGNHDTWVATDYWSTAPKHRNFLKEMGTNPYIHLEVNGIHFIGCSPDETENTLGHKEKSLKWLDNELQKASADTEEGKPIFVITHHAPKDTMYGSDDWNDPALGEVLSKYENVVAMSGHSHYALVDERSIMQTDFTAFQTQCLSYIELETGKTDAFKGGIATIPPVSDEFPAMLIMNITDTQTELIRWSVSENTEIKADMRWTLEYPLTKSNFAYTYEERQNATSAPYFETDAITYEIAIQSPHKDDSSTLPGISFAAAKDDDLVHSYEVVLIDENGTEHTYIHFTDFYLGAKNMSDTVKIAIDTKLPSGKYTVKVTAIDSFAKRSNTITAEINHI